MICLKQKKMMEGELEKLAHARFALETANLRIEAANVKNQSLTALHCASMVDEYEFKKFVYIFF